MVEVATRAHSFAASTSPASTASLVLRVHVRTRDRHAAFATRLRSLCLMRLRAPGLFAICSGAAQTRRCGAGANAEAALMTATKIKLRAMVAARVFSSAGVGDVGAAFKSSLVCVELWLTRPQASSTQHNTRSVSGGRRRAV